MCNVGSKIEIETGSELMGFLERQQTECAHNPHGSYFKMEDGDSDEGGAGHLLTAWLGELDTLKKVRRVSQLRKKNPPRWKRFFTRDLSIEE